MFKKPLIFDHRKNIFVNGATLPLAKTGTFQDDYKLKNLHLNITNKQYLNDIKKVKYFIKKGDTYQVNHTLKYKFNFNGSPLAFYKTLREKQAVSYAALIKSDDFTILSFSPELFFRQDKTNISVRPMKGTVKRGTTPKEDKKNKLKLKMDIKNRAENLMIVDLLRNDLGKISKIGSVKVTDLFDVEQYKTLFQMTSTIKSKLKRGINIFKLFSSLFPSGSVTGAPKIRTMQLINGLEPEERKIYTGAIGFISPKQKAVFNVAIRTLLIQDDAGEMGIGGGITYASKAKSEFQECKLKAQFLTRPNFKLIETIRWSKRTGFYLLPLHLERLKHSAGFFGFTYQPSLIRKCLHQVTQPLSKQCPYKIRLLLGLDEKVEIEAAELPREEKGGLLKVMLSDVRTNSNNIFLFHKTTNRKLYNREYQRCRKLGYYDVLFKNEKGEITESAISNIFIKKGAFFYTPHLSCGLLAGVFRKHFLHKYKKKVREKILTIKDLQTADEIYCGNSVRGMVKVKLKIKK